MSPTSFCQRIVLTFSGTLAFTNTFWNQFANFSKICNKVKNHGTDLGKSMPCGVSWSHLVGLLQIFSLGELGCILFQLPYLFISKKEVYMNKCFSLGLCLGSQLSCILASLVELNCYCFSLKNVLIQCKKNKKITAHH